MPLLEASSLKKRFNDVVAVDGLDLAVEPGEIFGLVGPDGAGKTTSLRLLVGVIDPDFGHASIGGIRVDQHPDQARELLGYMPQQYSLYADLSVAENLRFFADMYFVTGKEREKRLKRLYEFSRLEAFSDRRAGKLSGGMYKKLALMCNMIHTPRILLLDEPTTGVDPLSRRELWEILYAFADEGVAVIVCTPYMDEAERCHRLGLMSNGRFLITDQPKTILDNFEEEVYEIETSDRDQAQKVLAEDRAVLRSYPVGGVFKAVCAPGSGTLAVEAALRKGGVAYQSLDRVPPNFEDVFLSYRERER